MLPDTELGIKEAYPPCNNVGPPLSRPASLRYSAWKKRANTFSLSTADSEEPGVGQCMASFFPKINPILKYPIALGEWDLLKKKKKVSY